MALSGSTTVNATSHDKLIFSWSATQSTSAKTSTVSWNMKLKSDSSGYISSSASKRWSVTVNGTKYSGSNTVGISKNSTKTLASGTTVVNHNSDGTKTFNYSFSQQFDITFSGSKLGTVSGSGSGTLDTIASKSTLAVSNGTIGTAQTLTVTKQNSSFTHTITWSAGDQNGTVCTKSSSTSISFVPPNSMAYANPNGVTVSTKFTIETFSNNTSLGSNSYTVSMNIPESMVPSLTCTITDASNAYNTYGVYVQGYSRLTVSITGTGTYGSSISGYYHTIDGKDYTGSTITTSTINSSGSVTVICTVYDSRGRRATITKSISVSAYSSPKITMLAVHRSNASGTEDMQGNYATVNYSYAIESLNSKNTKSVTIKYKKSTDSTYTTLSGVSANAYSVTNAAVTFAASDDSSYDIMLTVKDAFSQVSQTTKVSPAYCLYHIPASGKGITIGSIATGDGFNVNMDSHFGMGITQDVKSLSNTSVKDVLKTGTYFMDTTCTDTPVNTAGWLVVMVNPTSDYAIVKYYPQNSNLTYMRRYEGSWTSWILCDGRDNIIEQKTRGIWTYRTWRSGQFECWGNKAYNNVSMSTSLGSSLYISDYIGGDEFPFEFFDVPVITYSNHTTNNTGGMLWAGVPATTTKCCSVRIVRNNNVAPSGYISFHVIGELA